MIGGRGRHRGPQDDPVHGCEVPDWHTEVWCGCSSLLWPVTTLLDFRTYDYVLPGYIGSVSIAMSVLATSLGVRTVPSGITLIPKPVSPVPTNSSHPHAPEYYAQGLATSG